MLDVEDIEHIKKDIDKALPGELNLVKDCLERLVELKATEALLKKTEIGAYVNRLRKNPDVDEEIQNKCRDIVKKWKEDVAAADKKAEHVKVEQAKAHVKEAKEEVSVKEEKETKLKVETKVEDGAAVKEEKSTAETPVTERREGRTPKEDGKQLSRTGHTARDKCAEMIYTSLSYVTWASPDVLATKATAIEQATWEEYSPKDSNNAKYKERVRSLVFNLKAKDNPALRERVVTGELSVSQFSKMTTADMASDDLKKEWEKIQKQNLIDAQIHADNSAETDIFKCGKCGQRRTKYYQMQTRSADEPMTTFVTCLVCECGGLFGP